MSKILARIAEIEKEHEEYRTGTRLPAGWVMMGVGDGSGSQFVYGPYDAIKSTQKQFADFEEAISTLMKENDKLKGQLLMLGFVY